MTGGSVTGGDGGDTGVKHGGNVDVVPFFLGKGVNAIKIIRDHGEQVTMGTYTFFF